jgi:hypothetical protein
MNKIPTMFVRDESKKGHPVTNECKQECHWVCEGEGIATRKLDGMNVKLADGKLYKRHKPKERDYDMASYVECDPVSPDDKYLFQAFDGTNLPDAIYEAIGPKIQGNPEKCEKHTLVSVLPFDASLHLGEVPRTFEGLKEYLSIHDIEGIVFHHPDGRMAKIKKRDYGIRR